MSFIAPGVTQFFLGDDLGDLTTVLVIDPLMFHIESEFKPDLRFELFEIEIPLFHLVFAGDGAPDLRGRSVQYPFNDDHITSPLCVVSLNSLPGGRGSLPRNGGIPRSIAAPYRHFSSRPRCDVPGR